MVDPWLKPDRSLLVQPVPRCMVGLEEESSLRILRVAMKFKKLCFEVFV